MPALVAHSTLMRPRSHTLARPPAHAALSPAAARYMGVPFEGPHVPMTKHFQYATVRNERGREIWDLLRATDRLVEVRPVPCQRERSRELPQFRGLVSCAQAFSPDFGFVLPAC